MPDTAPLRLSNLLIPWRLAASVLRSEDDQDQSMRSVFCLVLLTCLFAVFAFMFGLLGTDVLWICSLIAAGYCAALLTLCSMYINVLSMRR